MSGGRCRGRCASSWKFAPRRRDRVYGPKATALEPPLPARVLIVTTVVWLVSVVIYEVWRIWTVLSGPQTDLEVYVYRLDFQLIASAFLIITRWFPILVGVLILEIIVAWGVAGARQFINWTMRKR